MKHFNSPKFLISVFLILFLCACTAHKRVTEGIKILKYVLNLEVIR